ncbi:DHA2 family multidrug resistance protein-like MFS transporter [Saccharopolyspora lacisalsi]|uniref:DHA2 family multidrug resistance protein-like MFS transporter n=1 Tax=Halosaccharopolyspora lacisalsi TaxID=1000566 RepID=A0A839E3E3_9PSEU|nr:MFS transporter [Halosaccharopolyspora lacisalsi]MBA8826257.1 DHA2 family multidrug resistance protein-like MFS transporter [Halosaccharopolyspora lacisalsi]
MTDRTPVRAGRREWWGLVVLGLPTLLVSMDASILLLALPEISAQLAPSSSELLWIVDIYTFVIAGTLVTAGTLGDRIGRRRLLLIGAACFGAASVLAAFSTSGLMLIAARGLLGLAGATLMPSTLALLTTMFTVPAQRARAIAVWMSCFSAGVALGPVAGGLLVQWFWWGAVFLVGVPIMVLLLVVGPRVLPEYREPNAGRLDPVSVVLSLVVVLGVVYGLKELAAGGPVVTALVVIAVGVAGGVVFVRRQLALAQPLVDLRLFANRTFTTGMVTLLVGLLTTAGIQVFVTQYLQIVLGLSPLVAGTWMVPQALAVIVGTQLSPWLAERVRIAFIVAGGSVVSGAGFIVFTQVGGALALAVVVVGNVVISLGTAPLMALSTELVVGSVPEDKTGSASALNETVGELGAALGVALLGSLGTVLYRTRMATTASELPPDARAEASDTISGAAAVADRLPPAEGTLVLDTARTAFTDALQTVSTVAAAVAFALSALVVVVLRHVAKPKPAAVAN